MTAMPVPGGNDHFDVLVIGTGPGGATAAARVAETGKRVLMLERGDFLPRERGNWSSRAVFGDGKYTADETFYDLHDRPFRPELHYYVGGNSKVYGAALVRLLPRDFGEVQHRDGIAPAWPLTHRPAGPTRNDTTPAMSSGRPSRPSGGSAASCSCSSAVVLCRNASVAVGPGATALTVTSRPRSSLARMRVSTSTAALDDAYALSSGGATRTMLVEMFTIEPPPRTRRAAC